MAGAVGAPAQLHARGCAAHRARRRGIAGRDGDQQGALTREADAIVVWGGAWLWVSWLLPHARDIPITALVPGALLFGLVVWSMHLLTVFYFARKVSHASDTYGAIGSAIGILLALYLIGRAMSAAATLNATRKQLEPAS